MKKLLYIIYLLLSFTSAQTLEIKIIHNIQNEIITNVDIQNEYKYLLVLNNKLEELDKNKKLSISNDSIIKEKIKKIELLKFFKKLELNTQYEDILLKNIYQRQGLNSLAEFEQYLKNYDLTLNYFKKKIIIDAMWNNLIAQKYSSLIVINKKKINEKIMNSDNDKKKEYHLSEILFEIKNKAEIKKKYNEIIKNINEKGFENTAAIYSFAESSKIGGDIGWINEGSLNAEIKKKIINLKIGEISSPIILSNGILILKIKDSKSITIKTDYKLELKKAIEYEQNRQLNQFSKIYFNKITKNLELNE